MNIEEYITTLTEQIRFKQARSGVAQEIRNHISDQTQAFEQNGMEHEKAVEMAVREMGDPVEAGVALDRIHRPQFDWRLFMITVLFSAVGVFIMYATGALGGESTQLIRQCFFTFLGIGIIVLICFADYTFIGKYALQIYLIMTAAFYVYQNTAITVNGIVPALRSIVYLYVPVYAGLLYKYRGEKISNLMKSFVFLLFTTFFSQRFASSLFIGLGIGTICTLLFLYAIVKGWFQIRGKRIKAIIAVFALVLVVAAVYILCFAGDYQKMRILAFLHPEEYMDDNYQLMATRHAMNGAQIIGESTGGMIIKQFVQEDMFLIFAQVVAMYGLIAGAAVIAAYGTIVYCSLHIVRRQKNQLGMILSAACFLLIVFNCTTGIFMNFGLLPLGSLQFPFLCKGGSGTVMYAVIIGLLMSCNRYSCIQINHFNRKKKC